MSVDRPRGRGEPRAPVEPGPPVTPASEGRLLPISPPQLTILVVCVVSIYFIISFFGKSLDSHRINQRAVLVRQQNARLEAEIKVLQEKVAYLVTDSYLETAAREKLNLVKPGDRPIVIVPAGAQVATVAAPPPPADVRPFAEFGHLADWLVLFFGG